MNKVTLTAENLKRFEVIENDLFFYISSELNKIKTRMKVKTSKEDLSIIKEYRTVIVSGQLTSEPYKTSTGRIVYNKIIVADSVKGSE